ncbi:hypothetical protein [Cardinium endosymbiont of Philonthus spinipes]|uniref:hypothetical protein n=1 Tax=Cardinium endosymbiont of Philonthus spinipes TaxID=3077941 RepID=UPI00313D0FA4
MNIFYLDSDVKKCAQYHCDRHVVKMILESTQILCTVLHQSGISAPYRPTHKRHPCVVWAGQSLDNWRWLRLLTAALNEEYQFRFNRAIPHQSFLVAASLSPPPLPLVGCTTRPLTMPDAYKIIEDPVASYRRFYALGKKHLLTYTKRVPPYWLQDIS